ncbi:MAG: lytic transglycosylase domain-containing protein [Hyphomicrobiaceae bacterium]
MADVSIADLPQQIAIALSLASSSTGADLNYLLQTASRESSFQVDAAASTSTARGLFQFIEETWIRTIKDDGARFGLGAYAERIVKTDEGRYYVPDAADRKKILALRDDPHISAMMAGVYAQRNADFIAQTIGRQPTTGELYIAHFLGPSDAARLIVLTSERPSAAAAGFFPRAAASNRSIFYRAGHARTVREVYDGLISRHQHGGSRLATAGAGGRSVALGSWDTRVRQVIEREDQTPFFAAFGLGLPFFGTGGDDGSEIGRVDAASLAWAAETTTDGGWAADVAPVKVRTATGATTLEVSRAPVERVSFRGMIGTGAETGTEDRAGDAPGAAVKGLTVRPGEGSTRLKVIEVSSR